jgi:hypothetical protein
MGWMQSLLCHAIAQPIMAVLPVTARLRRVVISVASMLLVALIISGMVMVSPCIANGDNKDVTIFKSLSGELEYLNEFSEQNLLYQGRFVEYPLYNAVGEEGEIVYVLPGDNIVIDHYNIFLFDPSVYPTEPLGADGHPKGFIVMSSIKRSSRYL